ncbi:MAG TPA: hypothetical protein VG712_00480, partial [Gemmatimonadales bacterium]|nr:hypothetical protein [Gemmatimonadales bacterium]
MRQACAPSPGPAVYYCTMRSRYFVAAVLLAACAHTEVAPVDPPDNPPPTGAWPRQLTFNTFDDRHPSWLPDGSGILYSTERGDQQVDRDRCIGLLPADGGSQVWRKCETDGRHYGDTTDVFEWPSAGPDGRTLFIHTTGWKNTKKTGVPRIGLATDLDFQHSRTVRTLPFFPGSKQIVLGWTFRWTARDRFVFLGVLEFFQGSTFYPDTFFTGQQIIEAHLIDDSTTNFTVVPGTDWASSVAVGSDSSKIYYTLGGDSIVYRRDLTTGIVDTVHNVGSGRIVRDVAVRGTTLAAVVGDSVIFSYEAPHGGMVQRDEGGGLVVVDLTTGVERYHSESPIW